MSQGISMQSITYSTSLVHQQEARWLQHLSTAPRTCIGRPYVAVPWRMVMSSPSELQTAPCTSRSLLWITGARVRGEAPPNKQHSHSLLLVNARYTVHLQCETDNAATSWEIPGRRFLRCQQDGIRSISRRRAGDTCGPHRSQHP